MIVKMVLETTHLFSPLDYLPLKSIGHAGPPSVSFKDPLAILPAIGPRAPLILTPAYETQ